MRLAVTPRAARASAAAAVVVLLGVASGCGSGDEAATTSTTSTTATATAEYADGVCTSLDAWRSSIESAGSTVKSGVSKTTLEEAANSIATANGDLVNSLDDLGTPPTPAATDAKAAMQKLVNESKAESTQIENAVAGISGVSDIPGAVASISASIATISKDLTSTVSDLKSIPSSDWDEAFSQSQACGELTGS